MFLFKYIFGLSLSNQDKHTYIHNDNRSYFLSLNNHEDINTLTLTSNKDQYTLLYALLHITFLSLRTSELNHLINLEKHLTSFSSLHFFIQSYFYNLSIPLLFPFSIILLVLHASMHPPNFSFFCFFFVTVFFSPSKSFFHLTQFLPAPNFFVPFTLHQHTPSHLSVLHYILSVFLVFLFHFSYTLALISSLSRIILPFLLLIWRFFFRFVPLITFSFSTHLVFLPKFPHSLSQLVSLFY